MTSSSSKYGPWSPSVSDQTERIAQLRSLAAISAAHLGSDHAIVGILRNAESDHTRFVEAQAYFDALPSLIRRRVLATFSAITWPQKDRGAS